MEVVRNTHFVSGKEDAIELALSEALANAVIHGAKGDPKKIVECDVAYDRKSWDADCGARSRTRF